MQRKRRDKMLFMISHEVRQPVANILGMANLFEEHISSPDEIKKILGYLKHSALSLDNFIKDLTTHIYNITQKEENRKRRKCGCCSALLSSIFHSPTYLTAAASRPLKRLASMIGIFPSWRSKCH